MGIVMFRLTAILFENLLVNLMLENVGAIIVFSDSIYLPRRAI